MVSAAHVAIAAFFTAAVLPRATWPLIDGDVWWHIRAGSIVLRGGGVPDVDSWSLVAAGQSWTSQDWLVNALMAALHGSGTWGDTALSLVFGTIGVASFGILWSAIRLRSPNIGWLARILWLSPGLVLAGLVMGVRTQVIDLLFTSAAVWVLWRYTVDPRRRWLILLPLLAVVWANSHAGWILLFLLGFAVLVGEAVDLLTHRKMPTAPLQAHHIGWLGGALVVSVVALVLNPSGPALLRYPFETLALTTLRNNVMEWFPADIGSIFGQLLTTFVLAVVTPTLLFGRQRLRTADILMLIGLALIAYQAIRFLLIIGPVGGAIAAAALSPAVSRTRFGRITGPALSRLSRSGSGARAFFNAALLALVLAVGLSITLLRVVPAAQARAINDHFPVAAVDWLASTDAGSRIFNEYEWGGYLGERLPNEPIFMDGRADVYGDRLLHMYAQTIGLQIDPEAVFDQYRIDHVLFSTDAPLARWLDRDERWTLAFRDSMASIWIRKT